VFKSILSFLLKVFTGSLRHDSILGHLLTPWAPFYLVTMLNEVLTPERWPKNLMFGPNGRDSGAKKLFMDHRFLLLSVNASEKLIRDCFKVVSTLVRSFLFAFFFSPSFSLPLPESSLSLFISPFLSSLAIFCASHPITVKLSCRERYHEQGGRAAGIEHDNHSTIEGNQNLSVSSSRIGSIICEFCFSLVKIE
jgi:hypothetical protein